MHTHILSKRRYTRGRSYAYTCGHYHTDITCSYAQTCVACDITSLRRSQRGGLFCVPARHVDGATFIQPRSVPSSISCFCRLCCNTPGPSCGQPSTCQHTKTEWLLACGRWSRYTPQGSSTRGYLPRRLWGKYAGCRP